MGIESSLAVLGLDACASQQPDTFSFRLDRDRRVVMDIIMMARQYRYMVEDKHKRFSPRKDPVED